VTASVSTFERRKQETDFGIDFRRVCYGLRDFSQEKDSIAFAKTMDRDSQPSFGDANIACELGAGRFGLTE
jgi:hypothetical protein